MSELTKELIKLAIEQVGLEGGIITVKQGDQQFTIRHESDNSTTITID